MHDVCTYHLKVQGQMDESVFNASSPLQISVVQMDSRATLFTLRADQSGLIGLIRRLHGQGFVILSVIRAS